MPRDFEISLLKPWKPLTLTASLGLLALWLWLEKVQDRVLEDLITLAGMESTELYRPGEVPVDGHCPVASCGLKLSRYDTLHDMQKHIHSCRERELLSLHPFSGKKAQYCFECFEWHQSGSAWEAHCQLHLSQLTKICNVVRAEPQSLLITPGHCPFCLSTPGKPSKQWHQFQTSDGLLRHIDQHLADIDFLCGINQHLR
jgi:hypothetical protein